MDRACSYRTKSLHTADNNQRRTRSPNPRAADIRARPPDASSYNRPRNRLAASSSKKSSRRRRCPGYPLARLRQRILPSRPIPTKRQLRRARMHRHRPRRLSCLRQLGPSFRRFHRRRSSPPIHLAHPRPLAPPYHPLHPRRPSRPIHPAHFRPRRRHRPSRPIHLARWRHFSRPIRRLRQNRLCRRKLLHPRPHGPPRQLRPSHPPYCRPSAHLRLRLPQRTHPDCRRRRLDRRRCSVTRDSKKLRRTKRYWRKGLHQPQRSSSSKSALVSPS
jgi:hypothetical protein